MTDDAPDSNRSTDTTAISIEKTDQHTVAITVDDTTIHIRKTAAISIHKLLDIGNGELPEYVGKQAFILGTSQSLQPGTPPHGIETVDNTTTIYSSDGVTVQLDEHSLKQLQSTLADAELTLSHSEHDIITLSGMMRADGDGIVEPLLHVQHDHILEHIHSPGGYWSPRDEDFYC